MVIWKFLKNKFLEVDWLQQGVYGLSISIDIEEVISIFTLSYDIRECLFSTYGPV